MKAHETDLREEVEKELRSEGGDAVTAEKSRSIAKDIATRGSEADLPPRDRALLLWAEKLTTSPGEMNQEDVDDLREAGWSDEAISDAGQVVAYFNAINRIADGLGVDLEPEMEEEES